VGFGRGKVILTGEHAVVHGQPAIAVGLTQGVEASCQTAGEHDRLLISSWSLDLRNDPSSEEPLERAFATALADLPDSRPPLEVRAEVGLVAGAGLGCSAALGVAVIRAIDERLQIERSAAELHARSLRWEGVFHGNPSGIDNAIAAQGGIISYTKSTGTRDLPLGEPLSLLIAYSGTSSSTSAMVKMVARQHARDPGRVDKVFDGIGALVRNAERALAEGNLAALGQLLDLNHALLASLMLSTPELETLVARARAAGALGAKVTGAGGGGCMLALIRPESRVEVEKALKQITPEVWFTEVTT